MERGPRRREVFRETQELLHTPEEAFDSSIEAAMEQNRRVMERLIQRGDVHRSTNNAEFTAIETGRGLPPMIQITWHARDGAYVLKLSPMHEGKGPEGGVFGYTGEYGLAEQDGEQSTIRGSMSLQELFGVPEDIPMIFQPTMNRWMVETGNPLTTSLFGEKAATMYMGLGFLFLGREWMHIGAHEAGHLPNNPDENHAWRIANENYAKIHRPRKAGILAGNDDGRFGLLKQPRATSYGSTPRLGDIAKYGLVSHARKGEARIPSHWDSEKISKDFRNIIIAADTAYQDMMG